MRRCRLVCSVFISLIFAGCNSTGAIIDKKPVPDLARTVFVGDQMFSVVVPRESAGVVQIVYVDIKYAGVKKKQVILELLEMYGKRKAEPDLKEAVARDAKAAAAEGITIAGSKVVFYYAGKDKAVFSLENP